MSFANSNLWYGGEIKRHSHIVSCRRVLRYTRENKTDITLYRSDKPDSEALSIFLFYLQSSRSHPARATKLIGNALMYRESFGKNMPKFAQVIAAKLRLKNVLTE